MHLMREASVCRGGFGRSGNNENGLLHLQLDAYDVQLLGMKNKLSLKLCSFFFFSK